MNRNRRDTPPIESLRDTVEERVEHYEAAWQQQGHAQIEQYLPPRSDPEYEAVALELMRVELEHSWRQGSPRPLEDYRHRFADVLELPSRMGELAFEDYRCRRQAGQSVQPGEYGRRFSIVTVDWPLDTADPISPDETDTAIAGLTEESDHLVEAIQPFPDVGDELAGFRLLEQLGQGTFGAVFRARQADLAGRDVVLKITSGVSAEPQHLARLQHTHIVPVYSVHQSGQLRVLCMPFFGRTTLADVLRQMASRSQRPTDGRFFAEAVQQPKLASPAADGPLAGDDLPTGLRELTQLSDVDACLSVGVRLADALAHAHQRGILHRDIKPANVLLTDEGQPMLLDFNISDQLQGRASLLVGGTLPYMSPEQRRSLMTGERVDPRSDVYSFGVLLYQLLTGKLPAAAPRSATASAAGATPQMQATIWNQAGMSGQVTVQGIRQVHPQIPRSVAALVARCLQTDPEHRYASIAEVRDDLQCHLAHMPLRHTPDRSWRERFAKWSRRHPAWVSGTSISLVAAALLVVAVVLLLIGGRQLRQYEAIRQLQTLQEQLPQWRMLLSSQPVDRSLLQDGARKMRAVLEPYGVAEQSDWQHDWRVRLLPADQQPELRRQVAETLYLLSAAEMQSQAAQGETSASDVLSQALRWNRKAQQLFATRDIPAALQLQESELQTRLDPTRERIDRATASLPPLGASFQRYLLAQEYIRQQRFGPAAELLEPLRDSEPLDYSTWFLLGNAYAGQGRLSEAEGCFTTCLALWPEAHLVYFNRGLCRFQMQDYTGAEADFTCVLQLREDLAAAWFNRALCRKAQQEYESADEDLTRALRIGGPESRTYLVRARVRKALGKLSQAEADRRQGMQLVPQDAAGWLARGLAGVDAEPEAALADFRAAERLAPASRSVLRNIAFVLAERLQRTDQAIEVLSRLIEQDLHAEDLMSRGVLRAREGQRDAAIRDGQQALQHRSNDKLLFQFACIYALNCQQHPQDVPPALSKLCEAILANPRWIAVATVDTDLRTLRGEARFRTLLRAAALLQQTASAPQNSHSRMTDGPSPPAQPVDARAE